MTENQNFLFETGINPNNNTLQNQVNINNLNIEQTTTEPTSSNIQDIVQKQKRLYDDIITLSSNINIDLNEKTNIDTNTNNNEDLYQISGVTCPSQNNINNNQFFQNNSNLNTFRLMKGEQSKKIDELINKFNNLYSSDDNNNDSDNYNNNNMNEEKETNFHQYNTISNILSKEINGNNNKNFGGSNISYDDLIYTKKNPIINSNNQNINNNNLINKTDNNIIAQENRGNSFIKKETMKQNKYYQNKNKYINRRISNYHNYIRPKYHSTNQISRSYRNTPERKISNKFYQNINKDNNNNNTDITNISLKANQVINEFKKTLLEAEKMENELNKSKNSIKTYAGFGANGNYYVNNTSLLNQTNKENISTNSFLNTNTNNNNNNNNSKSNYVNNNNNINEINVDEFLDDGDELEKLKMKNELLLKSNMTLKNKNKILSHEINTYKNSSIYKNPFSQYDKDLNIFIQDLKTSLDNATQTNEELEKIINDTQNENKLLKEKNQELLSNFELVKNECEKMTRENSELKVEIENKIEAIVNKDNNLNKYEKEINNLNNILNNNKNQIDYLNSIQESNKISQKDNEDLILELKNTIENLQKINLDNNNEILELKNKIEEYKTTINTKQNEINTLNDTVNEKEILIKNKDNQINEFTDVINETKKKNAENKNEIQTFIIENEKLKNDIKTTKMLLADRERTITSQKNSISFLTKTFNKNINMINNNINNAMHNEENENYDMNKGLKIIVEKMQKEIVELNKKNNEKEKERIKIEKDLNEYHEQYEQIKYDYQLLYQKYKEQNKIIETIKKEFIKRNNDNELQHLTKENFEILAKLETKEILHFSHLSKVIILLTTAITIVQFEQ